MLSHRQHVVANAADAADAADPAVVALHGGRGVHVEVSQVREGPGLVPVEHLCVVREAEISGELVHRLHLARVAVRRTRHLHDVPGLVGGY